MWSAIGGIVGGIGNIFTSVINSRAAKTLATRQFRLQSSLLAQGYQAQSSLLEQEHESKTSLLTQQKETTLDIIGAQKSQPAPVTLQSVNPETSFFGLESITSNPNFLMYAIIGLGIILLLLFLKRKRK